jgi:hypothetical protein
MWGLGRRCRYAVVGGCCSAGDCRPWEKKHDREADAMDGKGLFAGLLLGLGLGAALGVMYAPRAGSETREQLAETTERVKESLKERARSAPLVLIIPIAFQYQHQDQIQHHYPGGDGQLQ